MNLIWDKLNKKTYREGCSEAQFDVEFPFQVGRLMETRGLTVEDLVKKGIPRKELEGDKEYSRQTMHRLAAIFDVALLVTFLPFSELVHRSNTLHMGRFDVPPFRDDTDPALTRRFPSWSPPPPLGPPFVVELARARLHETKWPYTWGHVPEPETEYDQGTIVARMVMRGIEPTRERPW